MKTLFVGFIYKISKVGNTGIYIGSTQDLNSRHAGHMRNCNNSSTREHNYKLYKHIRENGGWDSWNFEIIETRFNITTDELGDLEHDLQIKHNHNLGTIREGKDVKQSKYKCECGGFTTKKQKWNHCRTKKHLNYLNKKQNKK